MHWPPPWHANTKLKAPNTFNSYVKALANLTQMHDKKKMQMNRTKQRLHFFFIQFPCFLLLPLNTKKKKKN